MLVLASRLRFAQHGFLGPLGLSVDGCDFWPCHRAGGRKRDKNGPLHNYLKAQWKGGATWNRYMQLAVLAKSAEAAVPLQSSF